MFMQLLALSGGGQTIFHDSEANGMLCLRDTLQDTAMRLLQALAHSFRKTRIGPCLPTI